MSPSALCTLFMSALVFPSSTLSPGIRLLVRRENVMCLRRSFLVGISGKNTCDGSISDSGHFVA